MDTASPQSGDLSLSLPSSEPLAIPAQKLPPVLQVSATLPEELWEELWLTSQAETVQLTRSEFTAKLTSLGTRYNYGLRDQAAPTTIDIATFFRGLHLSDLALAHACALGRDSAWQRFFTIYRAPLTQTAIAITGSATLGHDLADSLHSQLFGLTERDGQRRSPLDSYSGRGSFMGWLRTTLAQRYVDHHRRIHRESPLETQDLPAPPAPATPSPVTAHKLHIAIKDTLQTLTPEDRFLLSAYFLDQHTLHQIAQLLRVHEATVSRKLKRLTVDLRKRLLKNLQFAGLSKRAAEEALGTDPRDLTVNLRNLLQHPQSPSFSHQTNSPEQLL